MSIHKAKLAATYVDTPIIVDDVSLCFNAWNGLPGPYIKAFLDKVGAAGLYQMISSFEDKSANAVCTLTYCEGPDSEPVLFEGVVPGKIVPVAGQNSFGWDPVFLADGQTKTFAEMDPEEKNKISHRAKAMEMIREYLAKL